MADYAQEGGHWYAQDGTPCYTIVGKNGKERPTTLRDARQLGLVPSVTGIIRNAAAPALEKWKRNQVLLAALTLPRMPGEQESVWLARVEQDWQAAGRMAADKGTRIHGGIERHYTGQAPDEDVWDYVKAAKTTVDETIGPQAWSCERSFASPLGYGGKLDLHCDAWVVDIKTKDGISESMTLYDEHLMQLAAYRWGVNLPDARCGILYVDRLNPGARLVEATAEDLARGWSMFNALLAYWYAKNELRMAA